MTSVQRFISNDRNHIRIAAITASSVRTATAVETLSVVRKGNGRVRLSGAYSGHASANLDIEILTGGTTPRASSPVFSGIGSGDLSVISVAGGATQQAYTFDLIDMGVDTESAILDVREIKIRAKTAGAVGNAIRITVTPDLTVTPTVYSLLSDWPAGNPTQTGDQWNFGALALTAKGELDPASPRVRFGSDPTVYRLWREFKNGAWNYGTSPAIERDIRAGTRVFAVTGDYDVTVHDGSINPPEAYSAITFFDLLEDLAASALVEVAGVVTADRRPGGQAAIDIPLRTTAWMKSLDGKVRLQDVTVGATAPTQEIRVECVNNDVIGGEVWQVEGAVSGRLANAISGTPYTSAPIGFLVPQIDPSNAGSGDWSFKYQPTGRSEDAPNVPSVCVRPFRFGVNAKQRTVTFRYQQKPGTDCKCTDMPTPKLSAKCLGLDELGGTDMALDAAYAQRLQSLYGLRRDTIAQQIDVSSLTGVKIAAGDMDYCDAAVSALQEALAEIMALDAGTAKTAAIAEWDLALTALTTEMGALNGANGDVTSWQEVASRATTAGAIVVSILERFLHPNGHVYRLMSGIMPDGMTMEVLTTNPVGSANWLTDGTTFTLDNGGGATASVKDEGLAVDILPSLTANERDNLVRKYTSWMDHVRTLGEIVPKFDASSGAGACWRDFPDETHWWVDVDGYYLPAFTNQAYHSARRNTETDKVYSTKEFGFGLVVACPELLIEGDTLTIRIERVDANRPYQVGDEAIIQTVAAGAAFLTGGVDGTDELTWRVTGSTSGLLPNYVVPLDGAIPNYVQAGLTVKIEPGGIPFELGDRFAMSVEAGRWRWRKDAGAWSAAADIPASGTTAVTDGLTAQFLPGAAPSFVADDAYSFRALQPYAPAHLTTPAADVWAWTGASANVVFDLGSIKPLSCIALARYDLPTGSTVTAELSNDGITYAAPITLDASGRVSVQTITATSARYVRLSVASATGGSIGYAFAGVPWATHASATGCVRNRRLSVSRGSSLNASGLYRGVGDGWTLDWENWLKSDEAIELLGIAKYLAENDEPMIFVPHYLHPADSSLVTMPADQIEIGDRYEYQPNDSGRRMLSVTVELEPVMS